MRKMVKIMALLLAIAMIFWLTACGKSDKAVDSSTGENTASAGETTTSDEQITIKFANYAILEQGYTEFWEGVKTGFEEKYPNITIEWVTAPYGEITNQVINMAGSGDRVDIIFGEGPWTSTFEDAGLITPISNVLDQDFIDDFYPSALEATAINGENYAIPLYVSPFVLYYNKDIFEKAGLDPETPPTTYDEMLEMAEKISALKTEDGNKVYAFGQTTASVPISGSALTSMIYNFGGSVITDDGQLNADDQAFKQAFEMVKLLDEKGYNPQNAKLKDLRNLFALEQLAMYYDQSWGFNGVQTINPEAKNFTASAVPLSGGSGTGASSLQSHVFMLVDNGEANKEATKLLVEYIITPEVLSDYMANITPAYPAKKSMADMDSVKNNEVLKGAATAIDNSVAAPTVPAIADINLELCTLAQAVTVGGKDVDTAVESFKSSAGSMVS